MLVILMKLVISVISMILVVVKATLNFFWRLLADPSDSSKGGLFYRIVAYCYICLKPAALLAALNSFSYYMYLVTPFSKMLVILMKLAISVILMILVVVKATLSFFWRLLVADPSDSSKGGLFYRIVAYGFICLKPAALIVAYGFICLKPAALLAALNSVSYYLITLFSKMLLILMKLVISVIWMILKTLKFFWRLIVAEPSDSSKGRLFYIT